MAKSKNVLFIICFMQLLFINIYYAQNEFTSETISIKDGLSSNSIRDIIQDRYGYMWIASNEGVNIYDGYNIKIFKNNPEDSTSLPSNNIMKVLEDRDGTIWITTAQGLAKYNRNRDNFTTYKWREEVVLNANWMVHIYEDSKDNLWVMTSEGVILFNRDKETFERFDVMQTDNSVAYFANNGGTIIESSNGDLYCMAESFGLLKFDYKAKLFVQVNLKNNGINKLYYGS